MERINKGRNENFNIALKGEIESRSENNFSRVMKDVVKDTAFFYRDITLQ